MLTALPLCIYPIPICFCLLISTIFLWELECKSLRKDGLLAGRYSGTSRPDLNLTPHALQSVFGPRGPARHCGVFSAPQCWHFLPIGEIFIPSSALEISLLGCLHQTCWPEFSSAMPGRHLLRLLLRARTGTLRWSQLFRREILLLLLLLLLLPVLSSRTGVVTGVDFLILAVSGWIHDRSTNVSTEGNASLLDSHSSSSSTNSWNMKMGTCFKSTQASDQCN